VYSCTRPAEDAFTGSVHDCTAIRGEIGNRVDGAYQRYDGVPFRAAVSMSYPKDMYVRRYAELVSELAYEY
jgi:hypothetical protein